MKKLFIKTYGCQMNVYDSARMADLLAPLGYAPAELPDDADMVILNTCHIREKAAEKVYSELGRVRRLKEARADAGGRMIVAVAGCVAQAEGAEMVARQPAVDIVVGPQSYHRLPEMIAKIARGTGHALETEFPAEDKFNSLPDDGAASGPAAFLTVQEGCDKFCTFCVVPYTRGAEFSRPAAQILAEAKRLVARGAHEITLLGQNVNAYRGEGPDGKDWSLARLIHALAEIEGLARLRYTTSHPRDMGDELIAAHKDVPQLMPYLHLPIQSGSDRVLEAMNRQHGAGMYLDLVGRIRAARPDLALSSDFIVGFPGETDEDFEIDHGAGGTGELRPGFLVQIQRASRHARRHRGATGARRGEIATTRAIAGASFGATGRVQRELRRPHDGRAIRKARQEAGPGGRPQSLFAAGPCRRRRRNDRTDRARAHSASAAQFASWRTHRGLRARIRGGPLSPPRRNNAKAAAKEQVTLEFPDNALLAHLSGAHAKNFVRIEQKLGVRVAMRGNLVAVEGAPQARERAAAVLRALYARIETGEAAGLPEVDAELRFAAQENLGQPSTDFGAPSLRTAATRVTRTRSPAQAAYLDLMRTHPLVFGVGPAGTGKTYLAAAFGAHLLYERRIERLILSRPALEAGERLGFLPGDLREKIDPYLRPLYDALFEVMGDQCVRLMEQGTIEVAPLAFMRGRTLSRALVILDEAQNCSSAQMRMFLTRLGEDSRMVVAGNSTQSDLPGGRAEGLNEALAVLSGVEGVAVARFSDKDVVRHPLVTRIVRAYSGGEKSAASKRARPRKDEG